MKITQIGPGAWLLIGAAYEANSLVLVRGADALLIDAVGSAADARELRAFVETDLRTRARLIVSTHYFADHMAGLRWFPEAEIIAHEGYRQTWEIEQFRSEEETAFYVEPTMVLAGRMQIRWGDFTLKIFENPGHTPSTINVEIPELDLAVAGDSFVGSIAYIRYGDPGPALQRLLSLGRGRYLASHGGVRTDDAPGKALRYLRELRDGVTSFDLLPFERVFHERNLETLAQR